MQFGRHTALTNVAHSPVILDKTRISTSDCYIWMCHGSEFYPHVNVMYLLGSSFCSPEALGYLGHR